MFDEKLVTVWSAPNYCYRCGNLASILTIREHGERQFTVFNAAEENRHDRNMQGARRIVSSVTILHDATPTVPYRAPCRTLCNKDVDVVFLLPDRRHQFVSYMHMYFIFTTNILFALAQCW